MIAEKINFQFSLGSRTVKVEVSKDFNNSNLDALFIKECARDIRDLLELILEKRYEIKYEDTNEA